MQTVVIVIHLMVVLALVLVVLLQRSEGGALGIGGGGGGGGGFMSSRGTANVLTRVTAVLAASFFATSIVLTILARDSERPASILDSVDSGVPAPATGGDTSILDALKQQSPQQPATPPQPAGPQVPASQ